MLVDVKNYNDPQYYCENNCIGYKDQDSYSFNKTVGYRTSFAYIKENALGNISDEKMNENLCITIKCGKFSYAEIPFNFDLILGVTGTLKNLSPFENSIV